ncbi:MAG: 2-hydroxychromene-2-carboxylate isomerase [Burkholderiaceae bacterium]
MSRANTVIDYYYAPISAYAYLGEPRLIQIAQEAGVRVAFKPLDIMPVFEAAGAIPPARQNPQKLAYRRADTARTAARLGMPLNPKPAHWPVPMALAARTIIAAELLGVDQHHVSMTIMKAIQVNEQDISSPAQLLSALSQSDLPASALLDTAQQDQCGETLQDNIRTAIEQSVMGAPTYVVNGEMFFGQDRLIDLQWWLAQAP